MKNKNQKKLKNKKYRWGAYGRTTVGGRGCTPLFSAFYNVFDRSGNVKFFVFFRKCPKVVVLLQPKTKQKSFQSSLTDWYRRTDRQPTESCYIYNIYYSPRVQYNVVKRQIISARLSNLKIRTKSDNVSRETIQRETTTSNKKSTKPR